MVISRRASNDLDDLWTYLADRAGADTAGRVVGEVLDAFDRLADFPGIGHRRPDVTDPSYRFTSVRSYVIGYQFDDRDSHVVRVVHGSRDLGRFFKCAAARPATRPGRSRTLRARPLWRP